MLFVQFLHDEPQYVYREPKVVFSAHAFAPKWMSSVTEIVSSSRSIVR